MQIFIIFHAGFKFVNFLNATFIAFILKIVGVVELKDFCPISLVGEIYKIISNVLANRMCLVMDKIIFKSQNAFVWGRHILDLVLIANECVDNHLRDNIPRVLCKLDMEKAYNQVCWDFLFYMFRRCGFGERDELNIAFLLLSFLF